MKIYEYNKSIEPSKMIEIDQNLEMLSTFSLTTSEREYLEFATRMPTSEIRTFIEFYDNSSPKYDEIKFISILKTRYNESLDDIIKRVQQVRRIMKYEKTMEDNKNFSKMLKK